MRTPGWWSSKLIEPHLISLGPALSVAETLRRLGTYGFHGALDPAEGAIWCVERSTLWNSWGSMPGRIKSLAPYYVKSVATSLFGNGDRRLEHWDSKNQGKKHMSYIRGDYYLWADDSHVHIWARDGYDNWDGSVWNEGSGGRNPERRPSGVALPFEVADEFVVMRIAELLEAGELTTAIKRTLEKWKGNGGCLALTQVGERLKQLESEP